MSADLPREGETLGHYRVGRRLGGGGMGVVYEALDLNLDRPVALKVIASGLAEDPDFRVRFTREAQAQASLDSRHVVPVYAHGEDDGRLWIASRLVPDGDLGTLLTDLGPPPVPVAVDLIAQVADGLADAHAAGLVHRDIKPANVLLRRDDAGGFTAYLADFGIARQVGGEETRTSHATVGTPRYMAPELHTGGRPGVASDVYSLGCLLWATLTGRAPYAGTSDFEIVTAHREQPVPQLLADAPLAGPLNDVLRRTLAKDPADRPPSAAAVRDRLAALRGPAPVLDPTPGPEPRAPRERRLLLALAALVVLAVGAVGAYVVLGDGDEGGVADSGTGPTPSSTPSSTPTVGTGDEARAAASMAASFGAQLGLSDEQAGCLAQQAIEQAGLQHLVDIGMFDGDLVFQDIDLAPYPEVKDALNAATLSCAGL